MEDHESAEIDSPEAVRMLDELIKRHYEQLLRDPDEKIKIGDFLKMVELRRKLTPSNEEQKKFWKMLDKIRKETLSKPVPVDISFDKTRPTR